MIVDKRLTKILILFYLSAFFLEVLSAVLLSRFNDDPNYIGSSRFIITYLGYFFSKSIFIYIAVRITNQFLFKGKTITLIEVFVHFLVACLLSCYTGIVQIMLNKYAFHDDIQITLESIYVRGVNGLTYNFYLYFSIVAIVRLYLYFINQRNYELRQSRLQSQLLDAKIRSLQNQLQPHFLFNTLNDISALTVRDAEKAQNAISDLSNLLRKTIHLKETKFIPIEEEVSLLKTYLDIEKIRFQDKLQISINNMAESGTLVPPLILQPIAENSIKHGFSYDIDQLSLNIEIKQTDSSLRITVLNNGALLKDNQVIYGTGLGNLVERLDTLYIGEFQFSIKNNIDKLGVYTSLIIPKVSMSN